VFSVPEAFRSPIDRKPLPERSCALLNAFKSASAASIAEMSAAVVCPSWLKSPGKTLAGLKSALPKNSCQATRL